jgi:hypothetical protein
MDYGGMSWQHALELLDKCPGLKWVFDTANPIFNSDRSKPKPWPKQDPWEFWTKVRDFTAHIHVKDATWKALAARYDEPRLIELLPSITYGISQTRASPDHWNPAEHKADVGLSTKYGITSNLTLDATVNPDFGQVEADRLAA